MINNNSSLPDLFNDETSEGENSDDGLKIVIESPRSARKFRKPVKIDPVEKEIVETVEKDLEEALEEKAAKANLTPTKVKDILKHVVKNEHVVAFVRKVENPDASDESITVFEPKLTRAKAKQLYSSPTVALPWVAPPVPPKKVSSKVSVLVNEELPDDSSDDEYVPAEEESEDDHESSHLSETLSEPATPLGSSENAAPTNWSEDGIFKIPPSKEAKTQEEDATIALRTRSKLCLSSTPLEVIEEAFIPPDITTDMYDLECDDDDWKDFLKKFTRPLEEVTREEEDHDPEYNILADEEIDRVDKNELKEELREDNAVKVSRKELNELITELFEYADIYKSNLNQNKINLDNEPQITILHEKNEEGKDGEPEVKVESKEGEDEKVAVQYVTAEQKLLLEQQIRQHVQMLTQNFLLTYNHPEFHEMAIKYKEFLINLQTLGEPFRDSCFKVCNLNSALSLIQEWEQKFSTANVEVDHLNKHVAMVANEMKERKLAGLEYIPTFPTLLLKTVSESDVFLYPHLLPRIPFKPSEVLRTCALTRSEEELIAIGLEQFIPYLSQGSFFKTSKGDVQIKHAVNYVQKYLLPVKQSKVIYKHVIIHKQPRAEPNPIKYYFEHKRAPLTQHYYKPLNLLGVVPPKDRSEDVLPYQWKEYIHSQYKKQEVLTPVVFTSISIPVVQNTLVRQINFSRDGTNKLRKILPRDSLPRCTRLRKPKTINKRRRTLLPLFGKQSASTKKLEGYFKSPVVIRKQLLYNANKYLKNFKFNSTIFTKVKEVKMEGEECLPSFSGVLAVAEKAKSTEEDNGGGTTVPEDEEEAQEKDNPEDINALMVASSTIKSTCRKNLSGAEKKKVKMRREFTQNLAMLTPESLLVAEEKANIYAQAYYDKLREQLDVDDYHKIMEILNNHEYTDSNTELYNKIESVLSPKHPDLLEEFLPFLTAAEAKSVGKLTQYVLMTSMATFLRKLEVYFKDQPTQVKKIYRSITDLVNCKDLTMDRLKNTILPLLKGNRLLIDWFLQIFPSESVPESLLNGVWENVDIDTITQENCAYETITVPDSEDPYGGPNCICSCHNAEDASFKTRSRHCLSCGKRFMQGRLFIHTSKGLRLANITFDSSPEIDHVKRLSCPSNKQKRRTDFCPSKATTSPVKENQETETEEDGLEKNKRKAKSFVKSPKKKKSSKSPLEKSKTEKGTESADGRTAEDKLNETIDSVVNSYESDEASAKEDEKPVSSNEEDPNGSTDPENGLKPIEVAEWDCNTSMESVDIKHSPEHSADSGSEFCEESSQDNINSEYEESAEDSGSMSNSPPHSDNSNSNTFDPIVSWTRDEDKIILQTFQKEDDKEKALQHIAELLENRSVIQIKERFKTLMNLLQAMAVESVK